MPRRPRDDAHEALLDAARHEFARVGVERARVEDIARRAGISKGAFYLHFATKDEAFREILQRFLGALEDHARRRQQVEERLWREDVAGDPARLAEVFEVECAEDVALLELLWRHRQITAVAYGPSTPYAGVVAAFLRKMRAVVADRVRERQRVRVLRPDFDPEIFGEIIVGCYEDLGRRMAEMREKPDLAAWARTFLAVLYEGILPRPGAAAAPPGPPAARRPRRS